MANENINMDYDEYEMLNAEADGIAQQQNPNQRGVPQQAMNMQDVVDTDEAMEEEIEDSPEPKPVKQRVPHTSNLNARGRKTIPIINPKTGRPVREVEEVVKSTEEELEDISSEEAAAEAQSEGNQLAEEEKMPRWVPFHQVEKIGLINTQTKEMVEGFKDEGSAAGMAKILNEIDSMITGGGYQ